MSGQISSIENCGSIVVVFIDTGDGRFPVYFDHRPFANLLESEACNPHDLIGRTATFEDEVFTFEDSTC